MKDDKISEVALEIFNQSGQLHNLASLIESDLVNEEVRQKLKEQFWKSIENLSEQLKELSKNRN